MRTYHESISSRVRRVAGLETVEIRRRNTLADFRARSAEAMKHLAAAQDARDQGADAIDAVALEVAATRETLKSILRAR